MTTSSDEQWRICKAITGKNGVDKQDAVDEEIDNATDDNAKIIELTFENSVLRKIYNDGNPMNSNDRTNSLKLDGRSKSNKQNKKGKYGIGGFYSRCKLAGQGKQIITSIDGDDIYRCIVDLEKLQNEAICPPNCWTGDHKYRPKWERINSNNLGLKHINGVFKEYIGEKINTVFTLEEVILHLVKKYNRNIKNNLKIIVIWDEKRYILPDIYNFTFTNYNIDVYKNSEGLLDYYNEFNGKTVKSSVKLTPNFKSIKDGKRIGTYSLNIGIPQNTDVVLSSENEKLDTDSKKKGYITNKYIQNNINKILTGLSYEDDLINLMCGENSVNFSIDETKSEIDNYVQTTMDLFIPEIFILMDENTLCYKDFNRKLAMLSGGDMADKKIYQIFSVELNFNSNDNELDLSQEDKNKVELPKRLSKIISKIIDNVQKDINTELLTNYKDLENSLEQAILTQESDAESINDSESITDQENISNDDMVIDNDNFTDEDREREEISFIEQSAINQINVDDQQNNLHKQDINSSKEANFLENDLNVDNVSENEGENEGENRYENAGENGDENANSNDNRSLNTLYNSKQIKVTGHYKGYIDKQEARLICDNFLELFSDKVTHVEPINNMLSFINQNKN